MFSTKCSSKGNPSDPEAPFHTSLPCGRDAAREARAGLALQVRAVLPSGQVLTAVQTRAIFYAKGMPDAATQSKGYGLGDVRCTGTMMKI